MVNVPKSHLTIGRASFCELRVEATAVADEHMRVWIDGGHLWGQDLGTPGGTIMNGSPMPPLRPVLFRETDLFKLGNSEQTFSFQSQQGGHVRQSSLARRPVEVPVLENVVPQEKFDHVVAENRALMEQIAELRKRREEEPSDDEITHVSQVKRDALREIQDIKEAEMRRFETWKRDSVKELEDTITRMIYSKSKKALSKDEVCKSVSVGLRKVLLSEDASEDFTYGDDSSSTKMVFSLILAGLICFGYVFYVRWKNEHPDQAFFGIELLERGLASKSTGNPSAVPSPKSSRK